MPSLASVPLCFAILVATSGLLSSSTEAAAASSVEVSQPATPSWFTNQRNKCACYKLLDEPRTSGARYWTPSLANLFLYSTARQVSGEPASNRLALLGGKRSSSALDSLAGVTIGKRSSVAPMAELINFEPIYGRRFGPPNSMPRVFDMRTTPFDSYETDYLE